MNKKITGGIIVAVVAVVIILGGLWWAGFIGNSDRHLYRLIKNDPALVQLYNSAEAKEQKIKDNPNDQASYLGAALDWKSIAEQYNGDKIPFFKRSLQDYSAGADKFGSKNILFYLNGGKVAERIPDFATAEAYYKKAIEISSADENGYIDLADLYSYQLHKGEDEVLPIYAQGIKVMYNPSPLIAARAKYLYRIGDYAKALPDYETLSQDFPNDQGFKTIIQEIQSKLQTNK